MGTTKQDAKPEGVSPAPPHSEAFKRDAVRLVTAEGYTFAAAPKAVGVSDQTLRLWRKKFGPASQACGENATGRLRTIPSIEAGVRLHAAAHPLTHFHPHCDRYMMSHDGDGDEF
jgi:transposase-like protein